MLGDFMIRILSGSSATTITLDFYKAPFVGGNGSLLNFPAQWGLCFFQNSPVLFDLELAKTSCVLACSAYYEVTAVNNLKQLGFENIKTYHYQPVCDTCACSFAAGYQTSNGKTLVGVIICGTQEKQWHWNFDFGYGDNHSVFNACQDDIYSNLHKYIHAHNLNPNTLQFYVTGHSKGGAAANLLCAKLIDQYGEGAVVCYTFAAPNVTRSGEINAEKYKSIFNLVNNRDFITHCPLEQWGYGKYGKTIEINTFLCGRPTLPEPMLFKITKAFALLTGGGQYQDFKTGNAPVKQFICDIYDLAPSGHDYYQKKFKSDTGYLTLQTYFLLISNILNHEHFIESTVELFSTLLTDLSPLTDFFMQYMNTNSLKTKTGQRQDSPLLYAHAGETYLAYLYACD